MFPRYRIIIKKSYGYLIDSEKILKIRTLSLP